MKLYFADNSPYARKVRVLAIELGVYDGIEKIQQMPRDNTTGFWTVNPLGRVPALITDEQAPLYDSRAICEYINTRANGGFFPAGAARWDALRRMSLGDGLLDAGLPMRNETLRAKEVQATELIERHSAAVDRVLAALDADPTTNGEQFDIGTIAVACALGWVDFRLPDRPWRTRHKKLSNWFDRVTKRKSFDLTKPK